MLFIDFTKRITFEIKLNFDLEIPEDYLEYREF